MSVQEHTPSELQPKSNPAMLTPTCDNFPVALLVKLAVHVALGGVGAAVVVAGGLMVVDDEGTGTGLAVDELGLAAPGRHWE